MKRKTYLYIVLVFCLLISGCSMNHSDETAKLDIVATSFAPYDFCRQIVGDDAQVTMLLPAGAESHSYEPTAQDVMKIGACDVFVYVGGESDTWIDGILDSIDTQHITMIRLMDLVEPLEEEGEHTHETTQTQYDEHVWTSPRNAIDIVNALCDVFCQVDAAHEDAYLEHTKGYVEQLTALDESFLQVVQEAETKTLVFGDRFPLLYFAHCYGLDYKAAYPGCAAQTEPNASAVADLIDYVRQNDVPVVFCVELSNTDIAQTIAQASGAKVLTFYACHNISAQDLENGETYLSLMQKNVVSLKEALG